MKKQLFSFLLVFMPMMAMGQVIAEADFTTAIEFTGWTQFDDSQTDGKVELQEGEGLAITVGVQTGQLWQPQVMVIPDGSFNLKKDGNYLVIVTALFPTDGTLQINMGSWSNNDQSKFPVVASGDFQTIECYFEDWSCNAEGSHLLFHPGDFKGTTIIKKITVIDADCEKWSIAGDESLMGASWDVTQNGMVPSNEETYTLTKNDIKLSKGTYNYKVYKDFSTQESYPSSNASLVINEDGIYSVKFTFNTRTKELSALATRTTIWTIAGDESLTGANWNHTINKMGSTDGETYTLTKTNLMLAKGTYNYKVFKDYLTKESYPTNNASLVIDENAIYTVKFTFNSNTKAVSATATKTDGIYFNYITKGKVAELKQSPNKYKGNIIIPSKVTHEGEEYTVTKIADLAFYGCTGLTSVTIPNSVTSIGQYAFSGCSKLTSVTLPSNMSSIGDYVFYGCGLTSFTIPSSVTSIGNYAFSSCRGLKNVIIPTSVTSIGDGAFQNCTGLTSFTIPNNIKNVSSSILQGCSKLTSVTIPNSVTSIGSSAFSGCSKLTSITIPNNVNSIGGSAFQNCSSLTSIAIPNSITAISSSVFSGCSGLTLITIPNSVTDIGSYAFQNCSSLTSITIPNNLLSIGYYAFAGCSKLASVTIPNSVTNLGGSAFSGCSKLASVTIGSGIISVNSLAFANCMDLANVYCMAGNVPNTSTDAFEGSYIEYATLHVPAASLSNYSNAEPWKNFASKVAIGGGDIPETQKCAKPTITFNDGKLTFSCATEGVEFISEITAPAMTKKYDNEISLSSTYTVTVFATKVGYINSDKASIVIQANSGIKGDLTEDGKVDVADHVELSNIIMGK